MAVFGNDSGLCPHGQKNGVKCAKCAELRQLIEDQDNDRTNFARGRKPDIDAVLRTSGFTAIGDLPKGYQANLKKKAGLLRQTRAGVVGDVGRKTRTGKIQIPAGWYERNRSVRGSALSLFLTPRQEVILEAYLNPKNRLAKMPSIQLAKLLGAKLGCSSRTIQREWERLKEKFVRNNSQSHGPSIRLVAQKTKGTRKIRYYLAKDIRLGKIKVTERLFVHDTRSVAHSKRSGLQIEGQEKIIPRQSAMSRLFGALIMELGSDIRSARPNAWPPEELQGDWNFNLEQANGVLNLIGHGPWTGRDIYYALGKKKKLCQSCGSPILSGFLMNGQLVTAAKGFCEPACKMKNWRRSRGKRN